MSLVVFFFFNNTATTEIYPLPLHAALPISPPPERPIPRAPPPRRSRSAVGASQAVQMPAGVVRRVAQLLGDAQQLVVLRDTVGARGAPGLDLPHAGRHREVGDERVLRFA